MKSSNKFMLYDSDEGFYDIFLFSEPIDTSKIRETIQGLKDSGNESWNDLETIDKEIKKQFEVEKLVLFTVGENDVLDIMNF